MRWWFVIMGLVALTACATPPPPPRTIPTITTEPPNTIAPPAPTTVAATAMPTQTLFFVDTISQNLIIQHDQLSQTVTLSNTIDFVAVRDDGTHIAIQPHDADITILNLADNTQLPLNSRCESMVWAPDGQSLICARYGNMYTIQGNGMSDTLTTMAEGTNAYSEFVWRPKSAQLWFTLTTGTTSQICTISNSTAELLCVGNGQQPRWSPSGQWLAYRLGDRVTVQSADASQQYAVTGMRVDNLFWRDDDHLLLISNTRIMQYTLTDRQLTPLTLGAATWRLIGVGTPIR